jgi:hypothetical protein
VELRLDGGRRELSNKLFLLEVRPYRATQPVRAPELLLLAAYGVTQVAPAAAAAPELPLLRWRFRMRPTLTMVDLAQQAGQTELVLGRDNMEYWPKQADCSRCTGDTLYLI